MPSPATQSVESNAGCYDWSSVTISLFNGRNDGIQENISKIRHGHKAFALLKVSRMTLFASFCETFPVTSVVNLPCVTEVASSTPAYSHISLTSRPTESTSGPELLA